MFVVGPFSHGAQRDFQSWIWYHADHSWWVLFFLSPGSIVEMSAIGGERSPLLLHAFPWLQTWGKKKKLRHQLGSGISSSLRESLYLCNIFLKTSRSKPGKYLIALVKQLGRGPHHPDMVLDSQLESSAVFKWNRPWWAGSGCCFVDSGKSRETLKSGPRAHEHCPGLSILNYTGRSARSCSSFFSECDIPPEVFIRTNGWRRCATLYNEILGFV